LRVAVGLLLLHSRAGADGARDEALVVVLVVHVLPVFYHLGEKEREAVSEIQ
jgi:hypothetical protein